jgi:hypothetical protein
MKVSRQSSLVLLVKVGYGEVNALGSVQFYCQTSAAPANYYY